MGTTFILLFQEFQDVQSMLKASKNVEQNDAVNLDSIIQPSILVVEDEEPVRVFSAHALRNRGYCVFEACNGEEALEIFKLHSASINVLISDVIMPGINGPELAAQIIALKPEINVILMSGYTEDEIAPMHNEKFLFLSKPFALDKLIDTVQRAMLEREMMYSQLT
jgi:two-component system cell cycle sensor histidine kinase/response regulator CckA